MASSSSPLTLHHLSSLASYQHALDIAAHDPDLAKQCERAANDLRTLGYAVVPLVVERERCAWAHTEFWRTTEAATSGRLRRPTCAQDMSAFKSTQNWFFNKHGILEAGELAHLAYVHEMRVHPRVVTVFARLYGASTGLVYAQDRINYQLAPEWMPNARASDASDTGRGIGRVEEARWLHTDQSFDKQGLHCVQGLVVCEDADAAGDASLELVVGSHALHSRVREQLSIAADAKDHARDWYLLSDSEKAALAGVREGSFANFFSRLQTVRARAGSLVLWDSRVFHQGGRIRAHATRPRAEPRPRFVIYVCMQPLVGADQRVHERKRAVFEKFRATSHWPLRSLAFGKPRTYGAEPPEFNFDAHVVRPLAAPGAMPVLERLSGLVPWGAELRVDIPAKPLLEFVRDAPVAKRPIDSYFAPAAKSARS